MTTLAELEASSPHLSGISQKYQAEVLPQLDVHEVQRKKGQRQLIIAVLLGVLSVAVMAAGTLELIALPPMTLAGGGVITLVLAVIGFLGHHKSSRARKAAKIILAELVCGLIGLNYAESPRQTYLDWFRALDLLPHYDRSSVEDEVSGEVEGIGFVIQEARLEEERTRRDKDGRIQTYYVDVFRGLVGMIDFHKPFSSTTIASADKGLLNRIAGWTVPGQRARLESPEFEKRFEVYTTDQVEARYLLTPAFMERLIQLDRFFKGNLEFAFDNARFLFAANHHGEWMETRGSIADLTHESYVVNIIRDVTMIHHLIDALNLDAKTKA